MRNERNRSLEHSKRRVQEKENEEETKVIRPKLSKKLLYGFCPFCRYGPTPLLFEWQTIPMCVQCGKQKMEEKENK